MFADDLLGGVSEDVFGSLVPAGDGSVEALADDCVDLMLAEIGAKIGDVRFTPLSGQFSLRANVR